MNLKWHNIGEERPNTLCIATVGCTETGYVFPIRCKRWNCPVCAPLNALHEAIRTANGVRAIFAAGLIPKFATITQPGTVATAAYAYGILHNQWDKFRNRWQYWANKQGCPNLYAAFVEGQTRRGGMPHFHIIATALPGKSTLSEWCVDSGLGYMLDLSPVKANSGAAWYVSKYSTKSTDAANMPPGFRRVRYSRDFPQMRFRSEIQEGEAIVREYGESLASWAIRCAAAFGASPREVIQQADNLLSSAVVSETQQRLEAQSLDLLTVSV